MSGERFYGRTKPSQSMEWSRLPTIAASAPRRRRPSMLDRLVWFALGMLVALVIAHL